MKSWKSTSSRSSDTGDRRDSATGVRLNRQATPQATFGGEFLHISIPAMAAAYLFHLCQNHAFIDGNKRVGANAAITFLLINNWEPTFDEQELLDLVLSVASAGLEKRRLIEIFESRCWPLDEQ
jgi:prophage maintenance system killer protein